MKYSRLFFLVFVALTTVASAAAVPRDRLIVTPRDGHQPILHAIDNAKSQILIVMFHLSNPKIVTALTQAEARGIEVKIILDRNIATRSKASPGIIQELTDAGAEVQLSSPAFSITHEKSLLIDKKTLFITTMNLMKIPDKFRDYGLVTENKAAVAEYQKFFDVDWKNAQDRTGITPPSQTRLVWSPLASTAQLTKLIASAKVSVDLAVENLGSEDIANALAQAKANKVNVRVVVPACVMGETPNRNEPYLDRLMNAGANVRVMAGPYSADNPYMHAKLIVVDGKKFYLGSINFSFNSLRKAREVGILTENKTLSGEVLAFFETDFASAKTRTIGQVWPCDLAK